MHSTLKISALGLLLAVSITACSTRHVYQTPANAVSQTTNAVNINTATVDELEKLPHIGRKTAEAIVEFRERNGPFRRVEHIMQIRGISEKRFAELGPYLKTE